MSGPRMMAGWLSSSRNPRLISFTPWVSSGAIISLPRSPMTGGRRVSPNMRGMLGPYTSASRSPIRRPSSASATARFAATVLFPTPPLPELTAMMRAMFGSRSGSGLGAGTLPGRSGDSSPPFAGAGAPRATRRGGQTDVDLHGGDASTASTAARVSRTSSPGSSGAGRSGSARFHHPPRASHGCGPTRSRPHRIGGPRSPSAPPRRGEAAGQAERSFCTKGEDPPRWVEGGLDQQKSRRSESKRRQRRGRRATVRPSERSVPPATSSSHRRSMPCFTVVSEMGQRATNAYQSDVYHAIRRVEIHQLDVAAVHVQRRADRFQRFFNALQQAHAGFSWSVGAHMGRPKVRRKRPHGQPSGRPRRGAWECPVRARRVAAGAGIRRVGR